MKSFKSFISEEVLPTANVENGNFDVENEDVRSQINGTLAAVTAQPAVTPYVLLRKVSKALSYFHIILPKRTFLEGNKGVEVYEVMQFGDRMGMTDTGEFVREVPEKHYLFFQYGIAHPFNVTYTKPNIDGMYRGIAKIVDKAELDRLLSAAEAMMAESCDDKATQSERKAGREEIQPETPSTKKAVADSEKGLDEAMTRKQKDMAVRRFMSHDPDAGERILAMGKKEREEKKSFASAKKEIKRLKEEEQLDEISKQLVKSYQKKSEKSLKDAETLRTVKKRHTGLNLAHSKLTGDKYDTAPASGNYKSPKVMAKEETLDELKKSTLGSYIKKAHVSGLEAASKGEIAYARKDKAGLRAANKTGEKREQGIERAAGKLAKEEYEKVESGVKKRPGETHTLHRRNPGHKTEYHTITTDRDGRKSVKTGSPKYIKKHWDKLEEEKKPKPVNLTPRQQQDKTIPSSVASYAEKIYRARMKQLRAPRTDYSKNVSEDNLDEGMTPIKKSYAMRKMKKKVSTQVKQGLGVGKEKTSTVLVTNKGDPKAATGGGVHRIPRDKYDPSKHNLASE